MHVSQRSDVVCGCDELRIYSLLIIRVSEHCTREVLVRDLSVI